MFYSQIVNFAILKWKPDPKSSVNQILGSYLHQSGIRVKYPKLGVYFAIENQRDHRQRGGQSECHWKATRTWCKIYSIGDGDGQSI